MTARSAWVSAVLLCLAQAVGAQDAALLGPLADVVDTQLRQNWQASSEDGWFVLRNSRGDNEEQALVVPAGPAPGNGRQVSVNVSLNAQDDTASVGVFLQNRQANASCLMEITATAAANLFCYTNDKYEPIATVEGAAKLDGSDLIEFVEFPHAARFFLNGQVIGDLDGKAALGADIGVMAYDRGTFGIAAFQIADLPPPEGGEGQTAGGGSGLPPPGGGGTQPQEPSGGGDDALAQIIGPLADVVNTKPLRDGWQIAVEDGWFIMENAAGKGDSFGYASEVGPPGPDGRITQVSAAVVPPAGMDLADIPQSSVGIILQNRDVGASCVGEIAGSGDGVLTCFNGDDVQEVARLKGIAKLDGSDLIQLVELPGQAQFVINGQTLGEVTNSPAQGGQIGVAAYERGRFHVADFAINDMAQGGQQPPPTASGGGTVAGGGGPDVAGEGPLPWFEGDSVRIVSAYLGVTNGIFMHEFGHALIGELQIPSTGPEEDAVDIFSALHVAEPTNFPSGDEKTDAIGVGVATYAALQWYYSGKLMEQQGAEGAPWQDEHTADLKRFRNTFCVMFGSNPTVFLPLAQDVGLDDRTLGRCEEEFNKQNRAWKTILAPHTRVGEWHPEGLQPADAPGAKIEVIFEPSRSKVGTVIAEQFGDGLRGFAEDLSTTFVLPRPLTVVYRDCDELNAWYSPQDASITMCYNLIENLVTMIHDIEVGGPAQTQEPAEPSGGGNNPFSTGGGQTQPQPQQQGGGMAFDELEDHGVPPTSILFPAPYKGPTPTAIPRAQIITTEDLAGILNDGGPVLMIDTRGVGDTIPNAMVVPDAGSDGSITDGFQNALANWLQEQTGGNARTALVFFAGGMQDRSSYNAALRAGHLGYEQVFWYRGGTEAWAANGLPLEPAQ
ncbi:MAG TPA: DUF4344 domain-containing metallopeptidase [Paracoccaceae bacterium]|nr:DUF4344 domain-containing metallopeptidase [Paracoccaceae bacterium]